MQIKHKIDNFLFDLFSLKIKDIEILKKELIKYYSYGPYIPQIFINEDWVTIEIDIPAILNQENDYRKTVSLCEEGRYTEAKPILKELIKKNPTNSEYHRIMGQILSDEGNQEEAINSLIDSLRWDPRNGYALIMMGNIFAKFKNDIAIAMKYYDQALVINPNDNIAANNIGANLLQQNKIEEAKKYFWDALNINSNYPNTHFALGMIAEIENDLHSAFYSTIKAIIVNKNKDVLYQNSVKQAFDIAKKIINKNEARKLVNEFLHKLEFEGNKKIELIEDANIPTAAKFEFAENYHRDNHIIRYNTKYPVVSHLVAHELVHLDFVIEAQKHELNQLFVSNQEHKKNFIKSIEPSIKKLNKLGFTDESISNYCTGLFDGMNRQIFNVPIDLFIEDFLFKKFEALRPYQFVSLYNLIQESIISVSDKKSIEISPPDILSKNKIYNIVNAIQFKELFGLDLVNNFKATSIELKQAQVFYDEYLQYKDDKGPAEEYELVAHWAEDLRLEKYFELINENDYRKKSDINSFISSFERDPLGLESDKGFKESEMEKFQKSQQQIGVNMAVVMFMVDAFQYFKEMPIEMIKKIAFEIALQGTMGYSPEKKDYRINSITGKVFSGYHILAYYYVSFALAIPEMLKELQLPYDDEYKLALTLKNE